MIRSIKRLVLAGVAAATLTAVAFAGPASASVNLDPTTGTGFVGKGDVQTAFGWNNAKFQAEANNLTFTMVSSETWSWNEVWETAGKKNVTPHSITKTISTQVYGVVNYTNRSHSQVDGIFLTGFGSRTETVSGDSNLGHVPFNGEIIVDRQNDRQNTGDIYPTDTIAENVTQTSSTAPTLSVSDLVPPTGPLGPVTIYPAPAPVVS